MTKPFMIEKQEKVNKLRIAILGSGVAGLSCALALIQLAGLVNVRVYEQSSVLNFFHRKGHGLMLMENGVQALKTLQVPHLLDRCTPLKRAIFQNENGDLMRTETIQKAYCMTRAALVEGLLAELTDDIVTFDHPCNEIEFSGPNIDHLHNTQFQPNQARRVQAVSFATGSSIRQDEVDLFIDATGWRSPLCRALNSGLKRPVSRVREVVTSTYLPELAAKLGSSFVKTVLAERGAAFGVLAPTSEHVIGFLQFDSKRYDPPRRRASKKRITVLSAKYLKKCPGARI